MAADPTPSAALRLRRPLGRTVVVAVLLAVAVAGGCELLARTDVVRRLLPTESVGCGQPQLDRKLTLLRERIRRQGPMDLLYFGSSQAYRGIDPAVVESAFHAEAGQSIRSFNFGLGGLSETGEEPLARMLVSKFRPRLLVIAASPYGLDDERGVALAGRLATNPWIRSFEGERTFDGWLVDHSYAFRSWLGWRFWTEPRLRSDQLKIQGMMEGLSENGYGVSDTGAFRAVDEAMAKVLGTYEVAPEHLLCLSRLLTLHSDVEIVMVEIPVHQSVIAHFRNREADYERGLVALENVAAEHGVPFWRYPADRPIPQDGWQDFQHLNRAGAAVYSRWLGERLGQAVRGGELLRSRSRDDLRAGR